jgi:hypothetical protein
VGLVPPAVVRLERTLAHEFDLSGIGSMTRLLGPVYLTISMDSSSIHPQTSPTMPTITITPRWGEDQTLPSAGTAHPRDHRAPWAGTRQLSVDMRHRSRPVRPLNGTRRSGGGSN